MYIFSKKKLGSMALAAICVSLLPMQAALASHKIYSPTVEQGEIELELRGHTTSDSDPTKDGLGKYKLEAGYGVSASWFTSLFAEYQSAPGVAANQTALSWENIFQLTEPGQYWVDVGAYLEYEHAMEAGVNDKLEGKLLLEKTSGRYVNTANIVLAHEVGAGASTATEFELAWRTRYLLDPHFEPSIEFYGSYGELGVTPSTAQDHRIGPVISGKFTTSPRHKLGYELGYLVGVSDAAPSGTLKFLLEYEM